MSNQPKTIGALSGLKVLDLSRVLAGPWSTQILGDLGADVIKVENPGRGDDTRTWGPPFVESGAAPWDAAYYQCTNRNKQAIAVDFSTSQGADIIRQLAQQADIVVENFKVGTLARYGLDYASLSALNPGLIYCSITGFGQTGPYANNGGYDFLVQGMSGLMSITGRPEGEEGSGPIKVGVPVSDLFCGLYAATSILAALNHRNNSGEGQFIDCALLDTQVSLLSNQAMNFLVGKQIPQRLGNAHPNVVPYRDFAAADDYLLVACGNDSQFQSLCRVLDRHDLAEDPRYANNAGRNQYRRELEVSLAKSISTWSAAHLLQVMQKAGVPGGPINNIAQMLDDPHIQARQLLQPLVRADGSTIITLAYPAKFSRTPPTYRMAPPRLGQDTECLLKERLDLSTEQIQLLATAGVIGGPFQPI